MEEEHKLIQTVVKSMKLFPVGEINLSHNYNRWSISATIKWNKKMTKTFIRSQQVDSSTYFVPCRLSKFHLFTLLSYTFSHRSECYSIYGRKSIYSDLLMRSKATKYLMEAKNATIKLDEKYLIFSGEVKKKDLASLSNIFKLNQILIDDINELNKKI